MSVKLIGISGTYRDQEIPVDASGFIIGRDPGAANVVLNTPTVSRSHAKISAAGDGSVRVEDLNSSNGTFLLSSSGRRNITGAVHLSHGERFCVGNDNQHVFEVQSILAAADGATVSFPRSPSPQAGNIFDKPNIQVARPIAITEEMLGGRGERFLASLIDGVLYSLIFLITLPITGTALGVSFLLSFIFGSITMIVPLGLSYALYLMLHAYFLHTTGQTIGKKIMGVYIARLDGRKAELVSVIGLRMILMSLLTMIPFVGWIIGIADVLFIFRQDRRTIHDMIAGTVVLKFDKNN